MAYKNSFEQKLAASRSYEKNKDVYKLRAVVCKNAAIKRNRLYILNYLKTHPCVECGESDPLVLQFDHKNDFRKKINISDAIGRAWGLSKIHSEILKCQVLCANCHARKTALQFGWYKTSLNDNEQDDVFNENKTAA